MCYICYMMGLCVLYLVSDWVVCIIFAAWWGCMYYICCMVGLYVLYLLHDGVVCIIFAA